MAPVKPMGIADKHPQTRSGVTGFVQEYNQEGPKTSDLNPDVVTENSVLPTPDSVRGTTPKVKKANGRPQKK